MLLIASAWATCSPVSCYAFVAETGCGYEALDTIEAAGVDPLAASWSDLEHLRVVSLCMEACYAGSASGGSVPVDPRAPEVVGLADVGFTLTETCGDGEVSFGVYEADIALSDGVTYTFQIGNDRTSGQFTAEAPAVIGIQPLEGESVDATGCSTAGGIGGLLPVLLGMFAVRRPRR